MLDFTELSENGQDLELLCRELMVHMGYEAHWAGRGPDSGRDLIVIESGDPLFGSKARRWLVQCKHMASADGGRGRSVGIGDLDSEGGIVDAVAQHSANGYLLVCSTQPSTPLITRLEAIEEKRDIPTYVWDSVQLERMLTTANGWAIAQRFFPLSASASGWQVYATSSPNRYVVVTRGFHIHLENRHQSAPTYQLPSLDMRLDAIAAIQAQLPEEHELRLRAVFCDDKHGNFTWYVDYLWGASYDTSHGELKKIEVEPPVPMRTLAKALGNETVAYDDGQFDFFELTERKVNRFSDSYDRDHYSYYRQLGGF